MRKGGALADLTGVLVLAVFGALLGLLWNPSSLRSRQLDLVAGSGRPDQAAWLGEITRADLVPLLEEGRAQVVDARPRVDFETGHIPGALPLWDENSTSLFRVLLMVLDPGQILVVVDDAGDGIGARRQASFFSARGHQEIRLLEGGLQGWRAAGLPMAFGWDFDPALYEREPE